MVAMFVIEIPFGQTASHSPSFEQAPKPSASIRSTMSRTRVERSTCPCGSSARCATLADVNSAAEAFLHAATHAPQPMHCAASNAASATGLAIGMALASARRRRSPTCSRRPG